MRYTFAKTNMPLLHITASDSKEARKKLAKVIEEEVLFAEDITPNMYSIVATTTNNGQKPIIMANDIPEFIGQIIDIFENFLDKRGIILDNPERDEDENLDPEESANIFGSDYDELQEYLETMMYNWNVMEPR